jgi:hypothetical protein
MQQCLKGTTSLFCRTDGYCIRDIVAKQRFTKIFHESTSYWFRNGRFLLQKAIQSASKLEKVSLKISRLDMHIMHQITLRNRKYTSFGRGTTGVKPTYLITIKILEQIFNSK